MISRRRKVSLALITALFGLTAGCLLTEIFLRFATPEWLSKEMHELNIARNAQAFGSDAGWSVERIDGRFVRFVPFTQFPVRYYEYNHLVHIDKWGGRTVAAGTETAPLIPFIGDSFPFGIGVRDEETFVSLLNAKAPGQYINLAVPGSALPNQLDQIEFRHKELHSPAVYVFSFFTGNDFMDIFRYHGKLDFVNEKSGKSDTIPAWLIEWLDLHVYRNRILARSYLLEFTKRTLFRHYFFEAHEAKDILPRSCLALKKGRRQINSSVLLIMAGNKQCIYEMESFVKLTVNHLEKLSQQLRFKPLFIVIPDKLQMNRKLLESKAAAIGMRLEDLDVERPNRMIENELRSHGISFFDVSECLKERDDAYYPIDGHFTPQGHRIVAQYLSTRLNPKVASLLAMAKGK